LGRAFSSSIKKRRGICPRVEIPDFCFFVVAALGPWHGRQPRRGVRCIVPEPSAQLDFHIGHGNAIATCARPG
jgi:hypothetical protein